MNVAFFNKHGRNEETVKEKSKLSVVDRTMHTAQADTKRREMYKKICPQIKIVKTDTERHTDTPKHQAMINT
jgi:hypothetical protein